jgi:hypothetical protein
MSLTKLIGTCDYSFSEGITLFKIFYYINVDVINNAIGTSVTSTNISHDTRDKIAYRVLKYYIMIAAGLSLVSGLPGGWWMAATIPADVTQFYYNAIQLAQELACIYEWAELSSEITL